jgi:hypothetical protein
MPSVALVALVVPVKHQRRSLMNIRFMTGGALASLALALLTASTASAAAHTSMYPVGDSISASSVPITIELSKAEVSKCTQNGGVFTISTKGFSEGKFTNSWTTPPTYTGCTAIEGKAVSVATSGTWTMSSEFGEGKLTVNVPGEGQGIVLTVGSEKYTLLDPMTFSLGNWNNGFTSPVSVGSTMQYGGRIKMKGNFERPVTFSEGLQTLTDVTHPSSLPVLGP